MKFGGSSAMLQPSAAAGLRNYLPCTSVILRVSWVVCF